MRKKGIYLFIFFTNNLSSSSSSLIILLLIILPYSLLSKYFFFLIISYMNLTHTLNYFRCTAFFSLLFYTSLY
ncbi:hypothetical protein BDA99DRAFT_499363 [Phascolomyces articulosus]|uniref:Uncharacterized protein n=1 Tax=Phascolomyces articulosus TaxID=60185 RepID=A0AAD5K7G0_9FUNG|nr:hypothetical protein BDA99DRAFT_499363 [Phascolomyces articulosus]